jgi:hypothetical protein
MKYVPICAASPILKSPIGDGADVIAASGAPHEPALLNANLCLFRRPRAP